MKPCLTPPLPVSDCNTHMDLATYAELRRGGSKQEREILQEGKMKVKGYIYRAGEKQWDRKPRKSINTGQDRHSKRKRRSQRFGFCNAK